MFECGAPELMASGRRRAIGGIGGRRSFGREDAIDGGPVARTTVPHRAGRVRSVVVGGRTLVPMTSGRRFVPAHAWTDPRQRRGLWGERLAIAYLTACGWSLEAHRFKLGRHDLDLVLRRGSLVAFVEVKTRASAVCGAPISAVTAAKCRVLARVASVWRDRFGRPGDEYRFDVVTVQLGGAAPRIDHIPDAWRMTGSWLT